MRSSHFQIERIFVGNSNLQPRLQTIIDLAHQKQVPIEFTTKEGLDRMVKGGFRRNVVGLIKEIPYSDLEKILSRWRHEATKALFFILDGLQDPQNFGSLIRTAVGCGVHGMVIPKDRAVGITPAVIRASAGATAHLPIVGSSTSPTPLRP